MADDCGIYAITSPSGKGYIGSSVRLSKRRIRHWYELRHGVHHCGPLQRAWDKYQGRLTYVILERCDRSTVRERERFWLEHSIFSALYNSITIVDQQLAISDEVKARISATTTGRAKSEATKIKMRKPKSAEHAAAISRGKRGKSPIISEAGLVVRRASMARAQAALAAKREAAKVAAHVAMLDWILSA